MALDATKVRVGVSGEVLVGLLAATAPATAAAATTGFVGLGYISEDGVEVTPERKTDDIKAWQNGKIVRTVVTEAKTMYKFTLIETTKASIEFAFGTTVTQVVAEGTYTADPSATGGRKSFIFDVIDGANIRREYLAEGELTSLGAVKFAGGEAIAYECEITGYVSPVIHDTALKT